MKGMMTVTMPDSATIIERLKSVLDEGSDVARFYASFAKTGGGNTQSGRCISSVAIVAVALYI